MKLLIVALPDNLQDEDINGVLASLLPENSKLMGAILTEEDLKNLGFDCLNTVQAKKRVRTTPFMRACESVMNRANHTIDEPAFRVEFYKDVLDNVIAREIVEVLSWGPKCPADLHYIKEKGLSNLVTFAKIALGILDNM